MPAWWFDLDAGHWREEGVGTLQPSSAWPGKLAWVVQMSHFTWWNCDMPWTEKSCVNVNVVDEEGAPVRGATVNAEGVSYTGTSEPTQTDGNGRTCIEIKRGATGSLSAVRLLHTATLLPGGKVLVAGGDRAGDSDTDQVTEVYDPATGTWSEAGDMVSPRRIFMAATLLPDGKVLAVGGRVSLAELYTPGR